MRTIKSCKEGDIIMDTLGGKCKVLARNGPIIFRSEFNRYDIAAFHFFTVMEAETQGWKVLTQDGREEVDIKELERLMPNVRIIRNEK